MARPIRPWFRFYVEAFPDPKLRRLKPEYRWLFVACLGAARQSPEPGMLMVSEDIPMTDRDIADYAGMDVRSVRAGMKALCEIGLITTSLTRHHEQIAYRSPTFQKRQFESDDVTMRTRKHRATSDDKKIGTFQSSSRERSGNGHGNVPDTETDTDTEVSTSVGSSPKQSREPDGSDIRSKPVAVSAYVTAREYLDRVPLADKSKVSGVVQQAVEAGYERSAIKAALRRLAKDSRPVTPDTLRIEIDGKGGTPSREPKLAYTPPRDGMRGREGW